MHERLARRLPHLMSPRRSSLVRSPYFQTSASSYRGKGHSHTDMSTLACRDPMNVSFAIAKHRTRFIRVTLLLNVFSDM